MSNELREEARKREAERESLRKERERFAHDVRAIASRPEGARFLARLLADGGIFRSDYLPEPAGAYRAGRRAAALELWRILRECLPRDLFVEIALGHNENKENGNA